MSSFLSLLFLFICLSPCLHFVSPRPRHITRIQNGDSSLCRLIVMHCTVWLAYAYLGCCFIEHPISSQKFCNELSSRGRRARKLSVGPVQAGIVDWGSMFALLQVMGKLNSRPVLFNGTESAAEIEVCLMTFRELWRSQGILSPVPVWMSKHVISNSKIIHELKAKVITIKYRHFHCDISCPTNFD